MFNDSARSASGCGPLLGLSRLDGRSRLGRDTPVGPTHPARLSRRSGCARPNVGRPGVPFRATDGSGVATGAPVATDGNADEPFRVAAAPGAPAAPTVPPGLALVPFIPFPAPLVAVGEAAGFVEDARGSPISVFGPSTSPAPPDAAAAPWPFAPGTAGPAPGRTPATDAPTFIGAVPAGGPPAAAAGDTGACGSPSRRSRTASMLRSSFPRIDLT